MHEMDARMTQTAAAEKGRADSAVESAEKAAGIGETKEESKSSDRDADGRRIWEVGEEEHREDRTAGQAPPSPPRDPSGDCGGQLDLSG